MKKVLKGMLCLEPMKRISPWEVVNQLGVPCQSPVVPSYYLFYCLHSILVDYYLKNIILETFLYSAYLCL